MDEAESIATEKTHLIIKGKSFRVQFHVSKYIDPNMTEGIEATHEPTKWKPLPTDFIDALEVVASYAGRDESKFRLTCVHLHPEYLEACDDYQICRWPLATGLRKEFLIRATSADCLPAHRPKEFGVTDGWIHFRNDAGVIVTCRDFKDKYPDLGPMLEIQGTPISLPKEAPMAAERAKVFTKMNSDNDKLRVEVHRGKLVIKGTSEKGAYYQQTLKAEYDGEPFAFMLAPKRLSDLGRIKGPATITHARLKIDAERYTYFTTLSSVPLEESTSGA
jgi:hypothetical protein